MLAVLAIVACVVAGDATNVIGVQFAGGIERLVYPSSACQSTAAAQLVHEEDIHRRDTAPSFEAYEPLTAVVASLPTDTSVITIHGKGFGEGWQCLLGGMTVSKATTANDTLLCPVSVASSSSLTT